MLRTYSQWRTSSTNDITLMVVSFPLQNETRFNARLIWLQLWARRASGNPLFFWSRSKGDVGVPMGRRKRLRVPRGRSRQFVFPHVFFCCKKTEINGENDERPGLLFNFSLGWARPQCLSWNRAHSREAASVVLIRSELQKTHACTLP